ncbi:SOS response-associated peptidase family protein [Vreelandella vilamensis]|uniref:SOS response-associated peptidase family protein n=1 Tax=Vreelandella vilamensis TaxID=531309 RepID=UPI003BF4BA0D
MPQVEVPPGTWIPAVRRRDFNSPLMLDEVWWSYKPHWANEDAPELINATAEKVATSKLFPSENRSSTPRGQAVNLRKPSTAHPCRLGIAISYEYKKPAFASFFISINLPLTVCNKLLLAVV